MWCHTFFQWETQHEYGGQEQKLHFPWDIKDWLWAYHFRYNMEVLFGIFIIIYYIHYDWPQMTDFEMAM